MKAASVQPVNFESLQSSSETSIQLDYAKRYCNLRLAMFSMTILFSIMLLVIAVILIISNVVGMADISKTMENHLIQTIVGHLADKTTSLRVANAQMQAAFENNLLNLRDSDVSITSNYIWSIFHSTSRLMPVDAVEFSLWNKQNKLIVFVNGEDTELGKFSGYLWNNSTNQVAKYSIVVDQNRIVNKTLISTASYHAIEAYETSNIVSDEGAWGYPHIDYSCEYFSGSPSACKIMMPYYSSFKDYNNNTGISIIKIDTTGMWPVFKIGSAFKGARAFLFHHASQYLLATNSPNVPLYTSEVSNGKTQHSLVKVQDCKDSLIAATAKHMQKKYGRDFEGLESQNVSLVELGPQKVGYFREMFYHKGVKIVLRIAHKETEGMDWVHVLAVPQPSYYGRAIPALAVASGLSLFCIVVTLVLGLIGSWLVSSPIKNLVYEIGYLQTMQLDLVDTEAPISLFQEISAIQLAFLVLVIRLKEYKSYLPGYILERDFGEEQESEEIPGPKALASKMKSVMDFKKMASTSSLPTSVRSGEMTKSASVVMVCRFENFHELFAYYSIDEMIQLQAEMLQIVDQATKSYKGTMFKWDKFSFSVVWNKVKNMRAMASKCALRIDREWNIFVGNRAITTGEHELKRRKTLRIVLCFEPCFKCSMGTSKKKQYDVFGKELESSLGILDTIATTNSSAVLVCDRVIDELPDKEFMYRPISFFDTTKRRVAYELISEISGNHSEWMYELDEKNKADKFAKYQMAFAQMKVSNYELALQLFKEFEMEQPEDIPTKKLIEHCEISLLTPLDE